MDIEVKALTVSKNRYVKREDVEGDEKILREMKGVLNKLTPEKFDTLILKVLDLEIDSVNLLRKVRPPTVTHFRNTRVSFTHSLLTYFNPC
jgi:hypothetical protein